MQVELTNPYNTNFCDFHKAEQIARNYDAVISLGHKLKDEFLNPKSKYLFLDFQDFDPSVVEQDHKLASLIATQSQIQELVDFCKELKPNDKLLIHCLAGIGRSSAGAIVAMCVRESMNLYAAKGLVKTRRIPRDDDNIRPNFYVINHYMNIKYPVKGDDK